MREEKKELAHEKKKAIAGALAILTGMALCGTCTDAGTGGRTRRACSKE